MKHRSEMRIIFDMLRALEHKDSITLRKLYEKARIGVWHQMQERYTEMLTDYDLARINGPTLDDTAIIGFRGHQFLMFYRELLRLMGERE